MEVGGGDRTLELALEVFPSQTNRYGLPVSSRSTEYHGRATRMRSLLSPEELFSQKAREEGDDPLVRKEQPVLLEQQSPRFKRLPLALQMPDVHDAGDELDAQARDEVLVLSLRVLDYEAHRARARIDDRVLHWSVFISSALHNDEEMQYAHPRGLQLLLRLHDLGVHHEPYILLLAGEELSFLLLLVVFCSMGEQCVQRTLALLC